jgi:hypothetical protein
MFDGYENGTSIKEPTNEGRSRQVETGSTRYADNEGKKEYWQSNSSPFYFKNQDGIDKRDTSFI